VRFIPHPPKLASPAVSLMPCLLCSDKSLSPQGYILGFDFSFFGTKVVFLNQIGPSSCLSSICIGRSAHRRHPPLLLPPSLQCGFPDSPAIGSEFWVWIYVYAFYVVVFFFFLELVCEDFYCLMPVCFSNEPISNAFSAFLPLASFWMSCSLLARGYLWVSLGFAFATAFSNPTGEVRVIYDPLPTICVYFMHCAFCFGCIVGEPTLYLMF
jgi:hypothetical protein